ncbi:MAG TPA: NTP transferase domain-containing protein [Gemmatimonadales bacterium]|nr:NTP transferase domain-containing protein [Gemmatimonadales bacterium]
MPSADPGGLILAGGEGSRLVAEGLRVPKPMVEVAGRAQLVHLAETLLDLGCPTVTCMVRDAFPGLVADLARRHWPGAVRVHGCRTPSSLHTLVEGLARVPDGAVFATMVDTVMRPEDWRAVFAGAASQLAAGADAVLAVTPFVDDEAAVYVAADAAGRVRRLGDRPTEPVLVTGGVYAFAPGVRALAREAVDAGVQRMRNFLARIVDRGVVVRTVEAPRIIDLDRLSDLAAANAWLGRDG